MGLERKSSPLLPSAFFQAFLLIPGMSYWAIPSLPFGLPSFFLSYPNSRGGKKKKKKLNGRLKKRRLPQKWPLKCHPGVITSQVSCDVIWDKGKWGPLPLCRYGPQRKPGWSWRELNDNLWEPRTLPPRQEAKEGLQLELV